MGTTQGVTGRLHPSELLFDSVCDTMYSLHCPRSSATTRQLIMVEI